MKEQEIKEKYQKICHKLQIELGHFMRKRSKELLTEAGLYNMGLAAPLLLQASASISGITIQTCVTASKNKEESRMILPSFQQAVEEIVKALEGGLNHEQTKGT